MMKIKAGEIKMITEGLREILEKELPVKPAYWLARIMTKLSSEFESFEKARVGLINKLSKKDKDGKIIFLNDEKGKPTKTPDINIDDFNKEYLELADQEIEIDIKPIKLADLGDIQIKPIILAKLEKIIEE